MESHVKLSECKEHRGLLLGSDNEELPVLITIEYQKFQTETIYATIRPLAMRDSFNFDSLLRTDDDGDVLVSSIDQGSKTLLLKGVQITSYNRQSARIQILSFEFGFSKDKLTGKYDIDLRFQLIPSTILHKHTRLTFSYTGDVTAEHFYPEHIAFSFKYGTFTVQQIYSYEDSKICGHESTTQIREAVVDFCANKVLSTSTELIKDAAIEELRDITQILSLCYRKRVNWFSMSMFVIITNDPDIQVPEIRRGFPTESHPERHEESIRHQQLINGGLQRLVKNYRNSTIYDALERAITFLVSSYAIQTIETSYSKIIMALESFCDGYFTEYGKDEKVPSGKWKKIEKILKLTLDELTTINPAHIQKIRDKLPELKSVATGDKIQFCCENLSIRTDNLWCAVGFEQGLSTALKQRNQLFHRANLDDPNELVDNTLRLQVLTERLILAHLQWTTKGKLPPWYDWQLASINK